jgi:transcriptional regulator with XRE-family HTH domain
VLLSSATGNALAVQGKGLAILLRRLRELRKRHGLSQEAFAEKAGMSYKYYQAVEAGRKKQLRLSTLEKLADAYGLELWQLLAPSTPKKTTLRNRS